MKMKTIATAVIAIALLVGIAWFGFPWTWDLAKDRVGQLEKRAEEQISTTGLIDLRRAEIKQDLEGLQDSAYKVDLVKNKLMDQEAALKAQRRKLAEKESFLKRSLDWIESHSPEDVLIVNDNEYVYKTVVKDAEARTKECQAVRLAMETLEESVKMLRETIANAKEGIQQRYIELQQAIVALDAAEIKLAYLEILAETRAFIEGLNLGGALVTDSRYEQAITDRILKKEAKIRFRGLETSKGGIVEYPDEFTTPDSGITQAYAEAYLGRRPASPKVQADSPALIPDEDLANVPSSATK